MTGSRDAPVRAPAVAGLFYPQDAEHCRIQARRLLNGAPRTDDAARRIGGIVPHAGWVCSGAIAAEAIAGIAPASGVDVVVIFGAIHTPLPVETAVLDSFTSWRVPGEVSSVAAELRSRVGESIDLFRVDDRFHRHEHAVEVELPLTQQAFAGAAILPVEVPPIESAVEIGKRTARNLIDANMRAVFLASSDLTHYGPAYGFVPAGVGLPALEWAKSNDRMLLETVERFRPEDVVDVVREHHNACGGGAIAAMLAACREFGASHAKVLRHANSYETLADVAPQRPDNAVGYAAVVVG